MGLSLGGALSGGSTSSKSNQSTQNAYTAQQTATQSSLGSLLQSLMSGYAAGGISQPVQAQQNQANDSINKSATALSQRMMRFNASRGMGASGQNGQDQTQIELGRQGQVAQSQANYANEQMSSNTSQLLAALNYAFNPTGATTATTSSGKGSGYSIGAGAGGGIPGIGG